MDTLQTIFSRRSIRKYQDKEVSAELVNQILQAAMSAPSAHNQQPWHFVVIRDKKLLAEIPKFSPWASMASEANIAILVCADLTLKKSDQDYWIQDCSAAVQNLLLACHDLGLGAVWTASYPMPDRMAGYKKLFKLPETIIPFALIPLGYPAEIPKDQNRFNQKRIHLNQW
ncbi:MAG: nitroreductase family protein [Patescibacteria group bacterium]